MKATVIPIVVDGLQTVNKGFEKRLEELEVRWKIETIKTTELRRILNTYEFSNSLNWCEKCTKRKKK